jgi:hypothetical protein
MRTSLYSGGFDRVPRVWVANGFVNLLRIVTLFVMQIGLKVGKKGK